MRNRISFVAGLALLTACDDDDLANIAPVSSSGEPESIELGRRLVPEGVTLDLGGLSASEIETVYRGSYLVNGAAGCIGCHSSEKGYLAGGNEFPGVLGEDINGHLVLFTRNLTPHSETGMQLDEEEFFEVMRTGKDFHDSEIQEGSQRLLFMAIQNYRFMLDEDVSAIYAYLKTIPPVDNELRKSYIPGFPFPAIPAPPLSTTESIERGYEIPSLFSTGPAAEVFADAFEANTAELSDAERNRVGRGSYLVNAVSDCGSCHTDGVEDGQFDNGLLPQTLDVNPESYLGGGVNLGALFRLPFDVFSRNLTPHPDNGLEATEQQFIEVMRFGADYRRPGGSLRVGPHFPAEFRLTLDDLQSIYAYLGRIPAVDKKIEIPE